MVDVWVVVGLVQCGGALGGCGGVEVNLVDDYVC